MRLDRNTNPLGKYALILIRVLDELTATQIRRMTGNRTYKRAIDVPGEAIQTIEFEPFFVLKYKDKFAAEGLRGYRTAVLNEAAELRFQSTESWRSREDRRALLKQALGLDEYANEIGAEIAKAMELGNKIPD